MVYLDSGVKLMKPRTWVSAARTCRSRIFSRRCRSYWASVSLLAAAVLFLSAAPTFAGSTVLGDSNWVASWDVSLDGLVDIIFDGRVGDTVFIEKTAEFIQPPNAAGIFPTIPITFSQVGPTTVNQIAINDEIITNSTGHDWTDFHFVVAHGGDAAFNQPLSDASTPVGFYTAPFDNQMWGGNVGPGLYTEFWVDGFGLGPGGSDAIIPGQFPGNIWNPGNGAFNGELFIDVVPKATAPYTVFTLKETPTGVIPEPSTYLVFSGLALCFGIACWWRKRRKSV